MAFKILDASAFYAGIPFSSTAKYHTTLQVYDEIRHIKKNHGALDMLLETGRLVLAEPAAESTAAAVAASKRTGDYEQLSRQDMSVIALCMELGGELVSDDYAVANVAESSGISVAPVMTRGIQKAGRWIRYCPGCRATRNGTECRVCGTLLKKRLVGNSSKRGLV
ncbi:MAG: nucleotide-binding protein [Nitrosopumilus sp. H13]|nr:MAG: nucleotide-binding protein [Nitrosopumilus sp. H13]